MEPQQQPPRRRFMRRPIVIVLLSFLLCVIVAIVVIWPAYRDATCAVQLWHYLGIPVIRDEGLAQTQPEWLTQGVEWVRCTRSGKVYIYRPFAGSVNNWRGPMPPDRMIGWCPEPSHGGDRFVLLEGGNVMQLSEAEFQEAIAANYHVKSFVEKFKWVPQPASAPAG